MKGVIGKFPYNHFLVPGERGDEFPFDDFAAALGKAGYTGCISVETRVMPTEVLIEVRDTGVGIAPEDHEAVFEEFRQVGASAAKQEGTGLGLALARKFIELHGGKIWVKSQVGVGSTFTFTLPFQQSSGV